MTAASNEVVASAYELFTMPYINKFDGPHPWEAFKAGYEAAEARAHSDPRPVAEGLREAERLIGYLFGTDRNTDGPRVVDLCFTAFMGRDKPNPEDGGKSDWFTDTKPNIDRCIAVMKDRLLAVLATHSPAPMAELLDAFGALLATHDEDEGMDDFADDDSVGAYQDKDGAVHDMPLTFGILRRARRAYAAAHLPQAEVADER